MTAVMHSQHGDGARESYGEQMGEHFAVEEAGGERGGAGSSGQGAAPAIALPVEMPIMPVASNVIFPSALYPLTLQGADVVGLMEELQESKTPIALFLQRDPEQEQPGPEDIYRTGTAALIYSSQRDGDDAIRLMIQGLVRVRLLEVAAGDPFIMGRVEAVADRELEAGVELSRLEAALRQEYNAVLEQHPELCESLGAAADSLDEPLLLAYMAAATAPLGVDLRQQVLEADGAAKLELVIEGLRRLQGMRALGGEIREQVQRQIGKTEREFLLREQLKAIQRELGQGDEAGEIETLRARLEEAGMPPTARQEAERELARLASMTPASPEYSGTRTYLDWLLELPWARRSGGEIDIRRAREILERDHYGLSDVKARIVEYLGVRKLRVERAGRNPAAEAAERGREPILCFAGPPGVGKTTLAQSIAEALERPFVRIPVGGMRDEAEIRGHRRTYLGALPGRIVQAMRRAGVKDPVILLDELDKLGADVRGDPEAALLEVLDPAQQEEFRDRYLDVPFDLSGVLFIATANVLDTVHPALRDRLEVIEISGYTEEEKLEIARRHLIPRQTAAHALTPDDVTWRDEAVLALIRDYTREAGVRNLEREIAALTRRVVGQVLEAEAEAEGPATIDAAAVAEQLGKPRYACEVAEATERPGVATGLVWTPAGGDIVFIEASRMPGGKTLTVTGQLGEVMKESAQAALTWVRSSAAELGIDPRFFESHDVHIHVPAGAVPKDGPSAGVTLTAALVSLLTGVPVRADVAMTGEITLRGRVLPVGGIKEKVLAARRAGLRRVILPARNERDLDELGPEIRETLEFVLVDSMQEALAAALDRPRSARQSRSFRATQTRRPPRAARPEPLAARAGDGVHHGGTEARRETRE